MEGCPLCNLALQEGQQVVLQNQLCRFLQIPQEVLIGSGLIVPIAHRETVFDVTPEEWTATYEMLQEVKALLEEQYKPGGYTIGWNCGTAGGQHIMHAHLHIIPRFQDEPLAGKGIRNWLKSKENQRKI
ncbi:HIT family protein [Ectobacillus ponti]|uniref:HIT domain-containing protein n=1 Tax=Ectobacillus ponti TaxID=2961894 RepID=A0AA41X9R9_9BACI|nr:HIT domain-containing protein [Ectobacillus ponti]MCP8971317.1 HIT domain-containing protein [Ectobacillus ponti]